MYTIKNCPKIFFWTWTEPDKPSGSPAVLLEILKRVPGGKAEIVCERKCPPELRKNVDIVLPITRLSKHLKVWPFGHGYRLQQYFKYIGVLYLVFYGLFRILKYRPDLIFTIYFNEMWIFSSYILSKITRIPVLYYIHDPYLEPALHRGGPAAKLAQWLEPKSLKHGYVIVLYESLRHHYQKKYGIDSAVVRHITTQQRKEYISAKQNGYITIGYAGMIYDNNKNLMKELGSVCKQMAMVKLRIFTAADNHIIENIGLVGDRIKVKYLQDYEELLVSLSKCDLLYLPLSFSGDTNSKLPTESLKYVLPTKVIDYLLAGPPILVHCPQEFEVSKFIKRYSAGFKLNSNEQGELKKWLNNWINNGLQPIDDVSIQQALAVFSAEKNMATLENVFVSIKKKPL